MSRAGDRIAVESERDDFPFGSDGTQVKAWQQIMNLITETQVVLEPIVSDLIFVDTFQINVLNGDCSVHLLVERHRDPSPADKSRGKILKAILMDGGNDGHLNSKKTGEWLRGCFKRIAGLYDPHAGTGVGALSFDAWVVTHWDADHWQGAMNLIIDDVLKRRKMQPPPTEATSYFKYDHGMVLTTLYCPNWDDVPGALGEAKVPIQRKPDFLDRPKGTEFANLIFKKTATAKKEKAGKLEVAPDIEMEEENTHANERQVDNFCKVVSGADNLLGVDFFTGKRSYDAVKGVSAKGQQQLPHTVYLNRVAHLSQTLGTYSKLLNQSARVHRSTESSTWPKLYCIAAAGRALGVFEEKSEVALVQGILEEAALREEEAEDAALREPEMEEEVATPLHTAEMARMQNVAHAQTLDTHNTWANLSSIISVLHFPGAQHNSLYWAGDATESIEMRLMEGSFFKSDKFPTTVAKWSHHGSRYSNPDIAFEVLKPHNCLVSAGTAHPHPSFEVVKRFVEYRKRATIPERKNAKIFATRFPHALTQHSAEQNATQQASDAATWESISPNGMRAITGSIRKFPGWGSVDTMSGGTVIFNLVQSSGRVELDGRIEIFATDSNALQEECEGDKIMHNMMPTGTFGGSSYPLNVFQLQTAISGATSIPFEDLNARKDRLIEEAELLRSIAWAGNRRIVNKWCKDFASQLELKIALFSSQVLPQMDLASLRLFVDRSAKMFVFLRFLLTKVADGGRSGRKGIDRLRTDALTLCTQRLVNEQPIRMPSEDPVNNDSSHYSDTDAKTLAWLMNHTQPDNSDSSFGKTHRELDSVSMMVHDGDWGEEPSEPHINTIRDPRSLSESMRKILLGFSWRTGAGAESLIRAANRGPEQNSALTLLLEQDDFHIPAKTELDPKMFFTDVEAYHVAPSEQRKLSKKQQRENWLNYLKSYTNKLKTNSQTGWPLVSDIQGFKDKMADHGFDVGRTTKVAELIKMLREEHENPGQAAVDEGLKTTKKVKNESSWKSHDPSSPSD